MSEDLRDVHGVLPAIALQSAHHLSLPPVTSSALHDFDPVGLMVGIWEGGGGRWGGGGRDQRGVPA